MIVLINQLKQDKELLLELLYFLYVLFFVCSSKTSEVVECEIVDTRCMITIVVEKSFFTTLDRPREYGGNISYNQCKNFVSVCLGALPKSFK